MEVIFFFSFPPFSFDSSSPSCLTESKWPTQNQKVNQLEPTNRTTSTYCPSHRICLSITYITCPQSLFPHYVQHSSPLSQTLGRKTAENSLNASSTQPAQLQSVFQACTSGAVNAVHRLIQVWRNLRSFQANLLLSWSMSPSTHFFLYICFIVRDTRCLEQKYSCLGQGNYHVHQQLPTLHFGNNPTNLHLYFTGYGLSPQELPSSKRFFTSVNPQQVSVVLALLAVLIIMSPLFSEQIIGDGSAVETLASSCRNHIS